MDSRPICLEVRGPAFGAELILAGEPRVLPPPVNVIGVNVSAIDMGMALDTIEYWIDSNARQYVCVAGVHGVIESQRDEALREIHNRAGMVTPDGMPLVWASRLFGRKLVSRVCGPDLLPACCERSVKRSWRHFFYGGALGVPELLEQQLTQCYPGLNVVGGISPPFRPLTDQEDDEVVREINATSPDIVWVGLSTPKQEKWMANHVGRLQASVLIGVGAAFDFHTGRKRRAPGWMQRGGLEWLYRVRTEPRRLWKRYAVTIPLFLGHIFLQATGLRSYGTPDTRGTSEVPG